MPFPVLRTALGLAALALVDAQMGCPPNPGTPHAESEADCNHIQTCAECTLNVACGWCGAQCHAAREPRNSTPPVCTNSASAWIVYTNTCPVVDPPYPRSGPLGSALCIRRDKTACPADPFPPPSATEPPTQAY